MESDEISDCVAIEWGGAHAERTLVASAPPLYVYVALLDNETDYYEAA